MFKCLALGSNHDPILSEVKAVVSVRGAIGVQPEGCTVARVWSMCHIGGNRRFARGDEACLLRIAQGSSASPISSSVITVAPSISSTRLMIKC